MKIEVIPFAAAIDNNTVENKTVVVIDVLRATSVVITALKNGAKEVLPTVTIEEANIVSQSLKPGSFLVCGERNAKKIESFNMGNSPLEYSPEKVKNKTIILSTTNGTRALHASGSAKDVFIGAFLNVKAVVKKVKNCDTLVLACSGTNNKFSLDDGMCAALIIDELSKDNNILLDDLGMTLVQNWRNSGKNLNDILKHCFHLNYLLEKGFEKDVKYCLQLNSHNIVPSFKNQTITISGISE